jgi:single-strand DNA-binding protein
MLNRVFLIGRLTRDPETRYTSTGIAVSRFSLAINRQNKKDAQGEADFIRIVAWRKLAEICNEYLRKGKLIAIEGRLQLGSYEKNGQKLQTAEVIADNMQMLDRRADGGESHAAGPVEAKIEAKEDVVPF